MKKILNLRNIILLIMFFIIEFFLTIGSFQFFKIIVFHKSWLISSGQLFSTNLLFLILKISKTYSHIDIIFFLNSPLKNLFNDFIH